MENIIRYRDKLPKIHSSVYVDPSARIIGDVIIEENASVWPDSVIRADENSVLIKNSTAIMDKALIEPGENKMEIGKNCLISHGTILHGCYIGNEVLIGIGAIILEGVKIGDNCIVGAGSLLTANKEIPNNSFVVGSPAKVVREVEDEEIEDIRKRVEVVKKKAREYIEIYEEQKGFLIKEFEKMIKDLEKPEFKSIDFKE